MKRFFVDIRVRVEYEAEDPTDAYHQAAKIAKDIYHKREINQPVVMAVPDYRDIQELNA